MKKRTLSMLAMAIAIASIAQQKVAPKNADVLKVDALLKQMTLEEKVGQMTQVTLAVIAKGAWANQDGALDAALLKKAVVDYKVGSI
jgi:beta-glucosidase